MACSINYNEEQFQLYQKAKDDHQLAKLYGRFDDLPPECVHDVYVNICRRDFDRTVEYLGGLTAAIILPENPSATSSEWTTVVKKGRRKKVSPANNRAPQQQRPEAPAPQNHPAVIKEESLTEENKEKETIEVGYEFIRELETKFADTNFKQPDGLLPVIQIKRTMAQELHALWIESIQRQRQSQKN